MNVIVLGGTRFFGRLLVEGLIRDGHSVTVATRGKREAPDGARAVRCERRDPATFASFAGQDWDLVYDQIGYAPIDAQILCEALRGRVDHLVFTSSQSVYGCGASLTEGDFVAADGSWRDAPSALSYADGKRLAEAAYEELAPWAWTALRIPIVLGEDDYTGRLGWHVDRVARGEPIGLPAPGARLGLIEARDAAAALQRCGELRPRGPLNVCARAPIVLRDLVTHIERSVGRAATVATDFGDGDASPFGVEADWYMDPTRAERLGVTCRPIVDWLPALIKGHQSASSSTGPRKGDSPEKGTGTFS